MLTLGIAGLADVTGFLERNFPAEMAGESRIVQGMDAAAALISDGKVIAAASEERFDRVKKSPAFPYRSIQYCLGAAGASLSDVQDVCFNFNFARYKPVYATNHAARQYWQECLSADALQDMLRSGFPGSDAQDFHHMDHHLAHFHAALASSGLERCLGVVMDAAGEITATSVYRYDAGSVTRIGHYPITQSLGVFYSLITQFLGYAFNEDEYKVMGLASFGDPKRFAEYFRSAILLRPEGGVEIPCLKLNDDFADGLFFRKSAQAIEAGLGFHGADCPMQDRADVSAALQQRFTEALFHVCGYYREQTGMRDLLLSGGCAENCAAIGELRSSGMFDRIHIAYASGDEGTALGAAAAFVFAQGKPLRIPGEMPFFGPAPQQANLRGVIEQHPELEMHEFPGQQTMLDAAATDIAADRIVALCDGRMEYGARALGNRSLLALPSKAANKDRINLAIKKRQNYRPFAPAVTLESAHRYFALEQGEDYPYMTMLTRVREEAIPRLPAIVHVDGTARVQTVDRRQNPAFHYLLNRLEALTGIPVVLNTSYNVNHQPIVCSEAEAVDTFIEMGIDALYLANAKVTRRG
jgi:carbamoyltransferase